MPTSDSSTNQPDPLVNLQKLVDLIAGILSQLIAKSTLIFGVGFLLVLLVLYLFFKLFGLV